MCLATDASISDDANGREGQFRGSPRDLHLALAKMAGGENYCKM